MRKPRVRVTVAALTALMTGLLGLAVTASPASATYPGHDGRIAFVRKNQIFTIKPDGTGVRQLTTSAKNYRPKWSPDGQRIAFVHETAAGSKDLWVMSATGSTKTQVTHVGNSTEPTWSPDGKTLAFGGGPSGALEKIKSTAPFGSPTVLLGYATNSDCCTDEDPSDAHPIDVDRFVAWSPDGTRIAVFNHYDAQLDDAIYMYYPATGEAREYAAIGADCCGYADWVDLSWGPTGTFGYASVDYADFLSDPQPSRIVYRGYTGKPGDTGPAPDPAGGKIAVTNSASGTADIYVQAINGSNRKLLTSGYQPDWQPTA